MLVPVQYLDRYEHFRSFLLVWVPPMDRYGRLIPVFMEYFASRTFFRSSI